jgi:hypothetical protein
MGFQKNNTISLSDLLNLGSQFNSKNLAMNLKKIKPLDDAVKRLFKPEALNPILNVKMWSISYFNIRKNNKIFYN